MPDGDIRKKLSDPLYYQLYTILLNRIKMGELQPGDMLPTEVSLVEEYNVSRATVRQAILDLARNGYVVREKSKGTFVKDFSNTVGYKDRVKGFTAISSQGGTIPLTSKVLEKAVVIPPKPVREALQLKEGERAFYLRRIRYIRDEANTFVEDWLPYKICEGIEQEHFTNAPCIRYWRKVPASYRIMPCGRLNAAVRTRKSRSGSWRFESIPLCCAVKAKFMMPATPRSSIMSP